MRKFRKKTKHRLPRKIKKAFKSSNRYWNEWAQLYDKLEKEDGFKIEHYVQKTDRELFSRSSYVTRLLHKKHHRSRLSVRLDLYCPGWCPKCPINFCCENTTWNEKWRKIQDFLKAFTAFYMPEINSMMLMLSEAGFDDDFKITTPYGDVIFRLERMTYEKDR